MCQSLRDPLLLPAPIFPELLISVECGGVSAGLYKNGGFIFPKLGVSCGGFHMAPCTPGKLLLLVMSKMKPLLSLAVVQF